MRKPCLILTPHPQRGRFNHQSREWRTWWRRAEQASKRFRASHPRNCMRSMQMRCKTPCKQGPVIWKRTTPMQHTLNWLQIQKSYHTRSVLWPSVICSCRSTISIGVHNATNVYLVPIVCHTENQASETRGSKWGAWFLSPDFCPLFLAFSYSG